MPLQDIKSRIAAFFQRPFFSSQRTLFWLWLFLPIAAALTKITKHNNNFLIFRGVFWHTLQQTSLYAEYPAEYGDTNHYGPVFSLIIAPFAALPEWFGLLCWLIALTLFLYIAIRKLPVRDGIQIAILWFCAHELLTALFMAQYNIAIAAGIVLTYICIQKEQDFWAAFFIILGTFVKLYGIVGLAFFFFSKHKGKLILSLVVWAALMFVAPMVISSPEYIISQYGEWYQSLTSKNGDNLFASHQNISLLGMVRKISGCATYSDLWLIIPGLALFALPYLRWKQFKHPAFQQTILASVLMFTVLFSTGSESSSYIIAFVGIALWYWAAPWKRTSWDIALMIFAFILTSLSPSDLFPAALRRAWVQPYALKALPVVLIWFKLTWEACKKDYANA
ncbi:MAG: DUF2029 domain-containing protein [Bacteroidaceae bacterium]|nr:DUF2029 domain-containing protein [Bacteroidaceae bacterium]